MASWLAMGGHGAFVWSAYGFCLLALGALMWHARQRKRRALAQIAAAAR